MDELMIHRLFLSLAILLAIAACGDVPTEQGPSRLLVTPPPALAVPGWRLIDTLTAQVLDGSGQLREGVPLAWSVTGGGGSVEVLDSVTDQFGRARALWTMGESGGVNSLSIAVTGQAEGQVTIETFAQAFKVDRLSSGAGMGCGLVSGAIWCWGRDYWANGEPVSLPPITFGWTMAAPGLLDSGPSYVDLAVAFKAVCGLVAGGTTFCARGDAQTMAPVAGLPPLFSLVGAGSASDEFCGLSTVDSTAWCWRNNSPQQVPASPPFAGMWMGSVSPSQGTAACGLLADSTARCWGDWSLGDGTTTPSPSPVAVSGNLRFVELGVGNKFACGRTAGGDIWCWGTGYSADPVSSIPGSLVPQMIATGAQAVSAAGVLGQMTAHGSATRWNGATGVDPRPLNGLEGVPVAGFAQNDLSCARITDGQVYCYEEMWDQSSRLAWDDYSPVQPVQP